MSQDFCHLKRTESLVTDKVSAEVGEDLGGAVG